MRSKESVASYELGLRYTQWLTLFESNLTPDAPRVLTVSPDLVRTAAFRVRTAADDLLGDSSLPIPPPWRRDIDVFMGYVATYGLEAWRACISRIFDAMDRFDEGITAYLDWNSDNFLSYCLGRKMGTITENNYYLELLSDHNWIRDFNYLEHSTGLTWPLKKLNISVSEVFPIEEVKKAYAPGIVPEPLDNSWVGRVIEQGLRNLKDDKDSHRPTVSPAIRPLRLTPTKKRLIDIVANSPCRMTGREIGEKSKEVEEIPKGTYGPALADLVNFGILHNGIDDLGEGYTLAERVAGGTAASETR